MQLDGGSSRQTEGTRLGLAISRRIADDMGGILTVKSDIGMDATLTLELNGLPAKQENRTPIGVSTEYSSVAGQRGSFERVERTSPHVRPRDTTGSAASITTRVVSSLFVLMTFTMFAPTQRASAQGLISAGVGVGTGVGNRGRDNSIGGTHAMGFVQVHPPLAPVAVRLDALLSKIDGGGTAVSIIGDAVFIAPVPIVQPYALVGFGQYGVGRNGAISGWNAGVGARLKLPSIIFFGEARHHQRIPKNLLTIGVTL